MGWEGYGEVVGQLGGGMDDDERRRRRRRRSTTSVVADDDGDETGMEACYNGNNGHGSQGSWPLSPFNSSAEAREHEFDQGLWEALLPQFSPGDGAAPYFGV